MTLCRELLFTETSRPKEEPGIHPRPKQAVAAPVTCHGIKTVFRVQCSYGLGTGAIRQVRETPALFIIPKPFRP